MIIDRRSLLSAAAALGISGVDDSLYGAPLGQADGALPAGFDQATFDFWAHQVSKPSADFRATNHLSPVTMGAAAPAEISYLYYTDQDGFQSATDKRFGDSGLHPKGDVTLSISLDTLRPSATHRKILEQNGTGSFRVDLKQGKPLPLLTETLNWSAIGSFQGQEQTFHTIAFDPKSTWGASRRVPLVAGVGFWAWNFSVQAGPTRWSEMLQGLTARLKSTSAPAPGSSTAGTSTSGTGNASAAGGGSSQVNASVFGAGLQVFAQAALSVVGMGMPAMATTGINAFDKLYAFMHSQSAAKPTPVFQVADTALLATTEARQAYSGRAVSLRPGTYVIVPTASVADIASGKYILSDSNLVPVGTKLKDSVAATEATLKDVTYCVVSVDLEAHV